MIRVRGTSACLAFRILLPLALLLLIPLLLFSSSCDARSVERTAPPSTTPLPTNNNGSTAVPSLPLAHSESSTEAPNRRSRLGSRESLRYSLEHSSNGVNAQTEAPPTATSIASAPTDSRQSFQERSRDAFHQLKATNEDTPEMSEEERRRIWLRRHRQHGQNDHSSATPTADLPGRRGVITLTTADLINRNQTCSGDLFKHKVKLVGCRPTIIVNRFCHGSCNSFYVPKLRSKKLKATFQSCSACVPSETDVIQVPLDCPDRTEKTIYRTVMRVKRCACRNIELNSGEEEGELEEVDDGEDEHIGDDAF